jgi:superfamily II DNA or RNA helicase
MSKTVKLRLLDEVSCIFIGLHGDHINKLYDMFGVHVPGYFFQPLYKLGRWDGKTRFFQQNGKTFIYLLERILPKIAQWGYKLEIEDLREQLFDPPGLVDDQLFAHIPHKDTGEPTILRPHQVELVNALIEHGHGIGIAATSAGKTIMCAALCHVYGQTGVKTLTIVPTKDLVDQTKADYVTYLGADNTGEYSGSNKDTSPQHIVSTWQALKNNPKIIQQFQMVIVDECQGLRGKVLTDILTNHAAHIPYRFGVTGTLPKEEADQMSVHVAVGEVKYRVDAAHLIDKGILSRLHIDVLQLEEDFTEEYEKFLEEWTAPEKPPTYIQYKDGYFGDFTAEKSYLQKNEERIDWIAAAIEQKRDQRKGNVLCLVDNIAFGRKLASRIEGAVFVNGQDVKQKDRKAFYDMFKEYDDMVVIATVHIAGTGLSINRIFNLFLIDPGKSFVRVIQAIGRGLRMASDKDFVNVWDVCSDLKYSKRHVTERISYYKEAKYPHKKHKVKYNA